MDHPKDPATLLGLLTFRIFQGILKKYTDKLQGPSPTSYVVFFVYFDCHEHPLVSSMDFVADPLADKEAMLDLHPVTNEG